VWSLLATKAGRTLYSLSAERHGRFVCTMASGCLSIRQPLTVAAGVAFFFKQISSARPGQGAEALGEVLHGFPVSWDRADLATHPVYTEQAGASQIGLPA
jgi:hypothetical protein